MSLSLAWPQTSVAQQYIDIDLNPPTKPKQPQQSPPAKKTVQKPAVKPAQKPPARPASPAQRVAPAQRPVAQPKQTAPRPSAPVKQVAPQQAAPAAKSSLPQQAAPAARKPVPTTAAPLPTTPPPAPAPGSAPTQPPVAVPTTRPVAPAPQPIATPPTNKAAATSDAQSSIDLIGDPTGKFKNRHGFTVDYTTWYETMKLTNLTTKGLVEGNTHYFGISFNYDYTVYRERWGFAVNVGAATGNAQAGTKDAGDYYERRVVWTGFRGGGRLFWRANNRIDLGLGFLAQSKSTKWPVEENFIVVPQANPHYFYYLDTRWRLNYRYELVQSFGTHLRSYALAWMLGLTYTLN